MTGADALAAGARAAAGGLAALARPLAAFAFPQRCPGCGAPADHRLVLCDACLAMIPPVPEALCTRCLLAGRMPAGCVAHPRHRAWAAWVYDERAAAVIQAFKFHGRPQLARLLAARLAAALPASLAVDLVTAVPLHPARARERGFDQGERIARELADAIGVPHAPLLARVRPTPAQARLGPAARRRNLAGAIAVMHPAWAAGRNVLIVDDVLTTGATLAACSDALECAGAEPCAAAVAWAA